MDNPKSENPKSKILRYLLKVLCCGVFLLACFGGGGCYWYFHRSQPEPSTKKVFEGIEYIREIESGKNPKVIHIVRIQLDAPGISFLVTPGDKTKPRPLRAQTTSQFLKKHKLQVAINGDFFFPFHSSSLLNYYPHIDDPVELEGLAASDGVIYSDGGERWKFPVLYISKENVCHFDDINATKNIHNAISGIFYLIRNGELQHSQNQQANEKQEPRTTIGVDKSGKKMIFVLIDGRQPNYSVGATLFETEKILQKYGAWNALNLDGGGSTALVIQDENGEPLVLNCPINNRVPGRERAIANHLGVRANLIKIIK